MASRYCNASGVAGQPPSEQRRRDVAWSPWWSNGGCPLCQREYALLRVQTGQSGIVPVAGISTTGGARQRSCRLPSSPTPVVCWFIDPALAQGNRSWVTLNPTGSPGPTVAPTPLSLPFYVLSLNGREERHWLSVDTGYPTDISASRALGANARIIPNRPTSGLTWVASSGLCDVTTNRGACTTP